MMMANTLVSHFLRLHKCHYTLNPPFFLLPDIISHLHLTPHSTINRCSFILAILGNEFLSHIRLICHVLRCLEIIYLYKNIHNNNLQLLSQ